MRQRFARALHVGLDEQRQRLLPALAHLLEHVFELAACCLASLTRLAELALAEQGDFARLALVAERPHFFARRSEHRTAPGSPPESTARPAPPACRFVEHRAHAAEHRPRPAPCRRDAACPTAPARWRPGRLPLSRRASITTPLAGASDRRLQFQHLGLQQHLLEQFVYALPGLWAIPGRTASPPHSSGPRPCATSSCLTRSAIGVRFVDLVDRDHHRHVGRLGVAMASMVCGITPSSAATTRITISVTFAPRARIAVKASWPGVSRKRDHAARRFQRDRRRCAG